MPTSIKLPADRLISLDELVKTTAAAVEPDQQTYKIVDHTHPGAAGTFTPREAAEGMHRMALVDAIEQGELIARSMRTRTPYGELGRLDSDWRSTSTRYGLTFEDAAKFCALLAIEVQRLAAREEPRDAEASKARASGTDGHRGAFAELRSEMGRRGADALHETRRRARDWVLKEWLVKAPGYEGNKSAFARDYARLVPQHFVDSQDQPVKVTEKTIRDEWLKGCPGAGKQARLPAPG